MSVKLANIINLTDIDVMRETKEIFDIKIKELRQNNKNKGKYLMLYSIKPWGKIEFIIDTQQTYEIKGNEIKENEMLLGEEI